MGELYDKYIAQKELDEQNIIRENTLAEVAAKEYEDLSNSIRDIKEAREERIARFANFKDTLKDVLIHYCVN